jgi:hypothetical protein
MFLHVAPAVEPSACTTWVAHVNGHPRHADGSTGATCKNIETAGVIEQLRPVDYM